MSLFLHNEAVTRRVPMGFSGPLQLTVVGSTCLQVQAAVSEMKSAFTMALEQLTLPPTLQTSDVISDVKEDSATTTQDTAKIVAELKVSLISGAQFMQVFAILYKG